MTFLLSDCRRLSAPAGAALLLGLLLAAGNSFAAEPGDPTGEVLQASGVTGGFCVQLGFSSPAMMKNLAKSGKFLVFGLAPNRESVAAARTTLAADGLSGLASAECSPLKEIPLADNLAGLLVAEDAAALIKGGLPASELARVLAPNGVACLGADGDAKALEAQLTAAGMAGIQQVKKSRLWLVWKKPRPAGMDERTHTRYGPDGNMVSRDQLIGPPNTIRWCAGAVQPNPEVANVPAYGGVIQMVSAGGRNFYLMTTGHIVARDAFSGLILWTKPMAMGASHLMKLVAIGDRLYASGGKDVAVLNAATGESVRTIATSAWGMLVVGDRLIAQSQSALNCFDLATGTSKWTMPVKCDRPDVNSPVAAAGKVYLLKGAELCAIDLDKGAPVWTTSVAEKVGDKGFLCFVQGDLLLARRMNGETAEFHAFAAKDGAWLWKWTGSANKPKGANFPSDQAYLASGLVWVVDWDEPAKKNAMLWVGLSPADGKVQKTWTSTVGGIGCHPVVVSDRYAIGRRPCNFMSWEDGKGYENRGARGACHGVAFGLANGQFYMLQTNVPFGCVCGAFIPGIAGWASDKVSTEPDETDRWEKGPAAGSGGGGGGAAAPGTSWPMFRYDGRRSNCTTAAVPAALETLWSSKLEPGKWPEALIRDDWKLRAPSGHVISGPTVAEGRVMVALTDAGVAAALDEKDGRPLWTYPTGGRLDAPPAITGGLALVGSHDGCVYALDGASGKLAWRFRAAPTQRRMLAFGQVESSWPVVGGVLVEGDLAYAVAGRSTEIEDGLFVYGIDVRGGKLAWSSRRPLPGDKSPGWDIFKGPADLLASDGEAIAISGVAQGKFDPKVGGVAKRSGLPKFNSPVRVSFNYVSRNIWGNGPGEYPPCPSAFDSANRYYASFQFDGAKPRGRQTVLVARAHAAKKPEENLWTQVMPVGRVVESLILAGDKLVVGVSVTADGKRTGEVLVLSAKDGAKAASVALPAAPVYEGLALAGGKLYASLEDGRVICLGAK
ncbi:MAG TPA: PQQ-binding-like beta-propeller repeat protein [Planctomycetota bacterium]|nr:PQQ-binding-like beta-propeller repeat protein [Planctomycetota bacterium]